MGETGQLAATGPAAAMADPPAASPGRDVPESAPVAAPQVPAGPQVLRSERLQRLAERAAAALALPVLAVDPVRELLPAEALARVLDAVEASTAAATKKAYRSDWDRFAGWAGHRRFPPLPAPPAVIAHYLTEAAAEQTGIDRWRYAPATLTRWVASINQVHTAAGLDPPGRSEIVRRALSGIRRIRATPRPGAGGRDPRQTGPAQPRRGGFHGDADRVARRRRVRRSGRGRRNHPAVPAAGTAPAAPCT